MASTDIDTALVSKLAADTTLAGLMTDGVYVDVAPIGMKRFVIVSLLDADDEDMFGGRAFENALYLVKAVDQNTSPTTARVAAARIDAILDPQPPNPPATLNVAGYGLMRIRRETRLRTVEVDEADATIRWQHIGGHYEVTVSA